MPSLEAVTPQRHAAQFWHPSPDYRFAAQDPMATLVASELPLACMHMPLGFTRLGEAFVPVALQGLRTGQNLWVGAQGGWRGDYIPAAYRAYPFTLVPNEEQYVLCVDSDSGLIDGNSDGQPFFDDDNRPVEKIKEITEFLRQVHVSRRATITQCAALEKQQLIQPWELSVSDGENKQTLQGLYRIDEQALNALPSDAFETLREAAVLPMIYCQMLSMRHIHRLADLARADQKAASADQKKRANPPLQKGGNLDLDFLNSQTMRFE